jgi:hypothetical protein
MWLFIKTRKGSVRKGEQEVTIDAGYRGLWVNFVLQFYVFVDSGVRGGGKCPEEEHTTCSGGRTIVIVTSAVYGEREDFIKYSIL